MKLLILSNQIKNIRRQHPCHHNQQCINNSSFFSNIKITKEKLYSKILDLRITFVNRFENMRFEYYLTKQKSMLQWKVLEMSNENPEIVHSFDYKRHNHALFQEFLEIYLNDFY